MRGVPLDDHAAMYVAASRRRDLPCVGVVRRFDERIDSEVLAAYAARLAANPQGFGRRVVPARLPGARAHWEPTSVLPPLRIETGPLGNAEIAALLDEEVSTQPDPSCDPGWRLTAASRQRRRNDGPHLAAPRIRRRPGHSGDGLYAGCRAIRPVAGGWIRDDAGVR